MFRKYIADRKKTLPIKAESRKQQILETTKLLYERNGSYSFTEIADNLGLTRQGVYRYFSKISLYEELKNVYPDIQWTYPVIIEPSFVDVEDKLYALLNFVSKYGYLPRRVAKNGQIIEAKPQEAILGGFVKSMRHYRSFANEHQEYLFDKIILETPTYDQFVAANKLIALEKFIVTNGYIPRYIHKPSTPEEIMEAALGHWVQIGKENIGVPFKTQEQKQLFYKLLTENPTYQQKKNADMLIKLKLFVVENGFLPRSNIERDLATWVRTANKNESGIDFQYLEQYFEMIILLETTPYYKEYIRTQSSFPKYTGSVYPHADKSNGSDRSNAEINPSDLAARRHLSPLKYTGEKLVPLAQKPRRIIDYASPVSVGTAILDGRFEKDAANIANPRGLDTDTSPKHDKKTMPGNFTWQEALETTIYADIRDLLRCVESRTNFDRVSPRRATPRDPETHNAAPELYKINDAEYFIIELAELSDKKDSDRLLDAYEAFAAAPDNIEKARTLAGILKDLKIEYNKNLQEAYSLVFSANYAELIALLQSIPLAPENQRLISGTVTILTLFKTGAAGDEDFYRQLSVQYDLPLRVGSLGRLIRIARLNLLRFAQTGAIMREITQEAEELL